MTICDMRKSDKAYLTPTDIAEVIRCKPYSLNRTIKRGGTLPFDYIMVGTRLKIPRVPFLEWAERMKLGGCT